MPTPRRPITRQELETAFLFATDPWPKDPRETEGLAQVLSAVHSIIEKHPRDDDLCDRLMMVKDEFEAAVVAAQTANARLDRMAEATISALFFSDASRTTSGVLATIVGNAPLHRH